MTLGKYKIIMYIGEYIHCPIAHVRYVLQLVAEHKNIVRAHGKYINVFRYYLEVHPLSPLRGQLPLINEGERMGESKPRRGANGG